MRRRTRQSGITVLEIMLATVTITAVLLAGTRVVIGRLGQATFDEAVQRAQNVALTVETNQMRVTATTVDPTTGVFTYTFAGRTGTFTSVAALNAEMGTNLAAQSPYETDYEYRGNGFLGEARFSIPNAALERVTPGNGVTILPNGANDSFVIVTASRLPQKQKNRYLAWAKREIYQESTR